MLGAALLIVQIIQSSQFQKQFQKLRLAPKIQEVIKEFFDSMTDSQARQMPNYQGSLNVFKKFSYKKVRIIFTYCKECYHVYEHIINCRFCDKNKLDRIIQLYIDGRAKIYRNLTPEKITRGIR